MWPKWVVVDITATLTFFTLILESKEEFDNFAGWKFDGVDTWRVVVGVGSRSGEKKGSGDVLKDTKSRGQEA